MTDDTTNDTTAPTTTLAASADVPTDRASRYAAQLAAHLGRKLEVTGDDDTRVVAFGDGHCRLVARPDVLRLEARASTADSMARVQHVVGDHLERFGARDGLRVDWVATG